MGRRLEKGSEEVDRLGHPQEMESAAEKRQRYRSIRIGQFVLFIFASNGSIMRFSYIFPMNGFSQ